MSLTFYFAAMPSYCIGKVRAIAKKSAYSLFPTPHSPLPTHSHHSMIPFFFAMQPAFLVLPDLPSVESQSYRPIEP
ncbi:MULTISPECIES: hypothetical protein [unclassified Coleofasciculus]|uniref:hypothetical protein n=1 Tax=unclassified Coleofasciculus TaxID=2692782 RepID=UPI001880DB2A|nr:MULTISPECIES: hypothetical protein [unclassified Coleofasciculus]MBE9127706.1 hypothetical protein [Coleofasciculus sp. LEGE 07081]MBE9149704.1 hypothetical protein [Coleofasciculus sp. LEGE 07092]